jgi:ammonia channel protein AmtB
MADATTAVSGTVKGIAGTAVTTAKAATADVTTAAKGIAGTVVTTAKAAAVSPIFAVAALGGIIAFEWWKGAKDAKKFSTAQSCSEEASN